MGSGEGEMWCGRVAHVVDSMRAAGSRWLVVWLGNWTMAKFLPRQSFDKKISSAKISFSHTPVI